MLRKSSLAVASLAGLLFTSPDVSAVELVPIPTCWRQSLTSNAACPGNQATSEKVCVEWEENGMVYATACCYPNQLPQLGCHGACDGLQRPPLMAPVHLPGLPDSSPYALKDHSTEPSRPLIPVDFEGRVYATAELAQLDGLELHYLFVLDDGTGRSVLFALRDRTSLEHAVGELNRSEAPSLASRSAQQKDGGVSLFAEENWRHAHYFLPAGSGVDFRGGWWAGKISSLRGTGTPTWITLFEGAGYTGPSLTFSTAWDRPTLKPFGFDDRVRSAYVWTRGDLETSSGDTPKPLKPSRPGD